ncbi:GspE/PulE family protein [Candidatus Bodocaedibacter vickermanii]|uniref:Type II secretion system protein E n=1 Tax=Candidatus Bodocaedibacter vickermanii TaxID=2741701 RepID=A0A7L9RTG8_9PROT|nr:Putative type II secretion system protein E [Candidatus Paracaedibacteraceae bacterium 'Lake Konstanz']
MIYKNDHQLLLHDLVQKGILSSDQAVVLQSEIQRGVDLSSHLQKVYGINAWEISECIADRHHYLFQRWALKDIDVSVASVVPIERLRYFLCLPIHKTESALTVVFAGSDSLELRNLLREYFPECSQQNVYCVPQSFLDQGVGLIPKDPEAIFKHLDAMDNWTHGKSAVDEISTDAVLHIILNDAYSKRASDIHFEPGVDTLRVRFRIDGVLKTYRQFSDRHWGYLASRIKVLGEMNTAESRRPQSGRFSQILNGHEVDIRAASHPTTQGESMVLRLLDKHKMVVPLESLGFCERSAHLLQKMYSMPHGLVLFTGPTGSGKTTTLYSILNQINRGDTNIMTLEDPVEYELQGIRQTSVQKDVLSFQDGIRAILRQDPDVILIGEIRDEDTAKMAFRASQTGHLVFSTLHTNDVWGVFPRLMDLGVSFESIKHTVVGIVSQRLVRKRCECFPTGCDHCDSTGLYGRAAIGEMLLVTPALRSYMQASHTIEIPSDILMSHYISLKESGDAAIGNAITTAVEVSKYCGDVK